MNRTRPTWQLGLRTSGARRVAWYQSISRSDGQNQIAIRFNRDLSRVDDSIRTLRDSIQVMIRFRIFSDLIHETRDFVENRDILHATRFSFPSLS